MRKLLVCRGLPGSGKSHTLARLGLTDLTISMDALRLLLSSPVLTQDGRMTISQEHNARVWAQAQDLLGQRMARGDTLVIDAVHPLASDFDGYLKLARQHRYEIACLDFSGVPADMSQWHNQDRADYRQVPAAAIERMSQRMAASAVPEGIKRVLVQANGSHIPELQSWLHVPVIDLDDYARVVHIGDIQGCHTPLAKLLEGGLRDDTFYIFVGDACDRGIENGRVMRLLIDEVMGRPNVRFLWGNHEDHLHRHAIGADPVSREFADSTLPQLEEAGVTREELDRFCDQLDDMVLYQHKRRRVMVTHAGLSTVPVHPWMIPSRQCSHGTGYFEDDVDTQFERNRPDGWVQVHGHRNSHHRGVQATSHSYNLEASVEYGGKLRALTLDAEGFHPVEVPNPVFQPFRARRLHRSTIVPPWMKRDADTGPIMDQALRSAMDTHKGVRATPSTTFPHVTSYSFTKAVFYDQAWDDVVVKARGLFVNKDTSEIVSRGYEKFFTLGEREDMTLESLRARLKFPVTGFLKENGFLGNVGFDRVTDALFVASKSRAEGDFAEMFKEILHNVMPEPEQREALKRYLRDTESCMTFEVIDPVRDPHMVEYDAPGLVLLDNIRRSTEFERVPYEMLQELGKRFGLPVKQRALVLKDWTAFEGWYRRSSRDMTKQVEGIVWEDATGEMFKSKFPFYSFWKLCRGMKDAIVRERTVPGAKTARGLDHQFLQTRDLAFTAPLADEFFAWCNQQDTETLRSDIITLRNAFNTGKDLVQDVDASPGLSM